MNKFRLTINALAVATFLLAFASFTQAQATRTWVSGVGDDANPCSRTAPCKTWAGAISKTATNGEIDALDPGGFGAVTVTKAITLDGTGTMASILNAGSTGVIINASLGTTDVVNIRGISINGAQTGVSGVRIIEADRVNIEDCVISESGNGILIEDNNGVDVELRNTVVRQNSEGLVALATGGTIRVSTYNCSFVANTTGLHAKQRVTVTAYNSVFSNNTTGVFAQGIGANAVVYLIRAQVSNNTTGIQAGGAGATSSSVVRIYDCDITGNSGPGVTIGTNGEIDSWQNNRIFSNGTDGCAGCLPIGFN